MVIATVVMIMIMIVSIIYCTMKISEQIQHVKFLLRKPFLDEFLPAGPKLEATPTSQIIRGSFLVLFCCVLWAYVLILLGQGIRTGDRGMAQSMTH